jgi:hypothetical protein
VPRFAPGDAEALSYLDEQGFVVFANALSSGEADQAMSMLWDYLEELGTGVDRNNSNTWDDDRWPTAVHGAILPSIGIGHCAAQWFIRDVANVKRCFSQVWDDEELLVSFDGVSLWRPWAENEQWRTNEGLTWMHIDQHPIGRPGKHCVQGLVNLLPTDAGIGGNMVVPGSHRLFEKIPQLYEERLGRIHPSIDHFRFPSNDPLLGEYQPIVAHMEPGDLMLWDSRTIHCSAAGSVGSSPQGILRAASLICMMPKAKSNPQVIAQRKAAIETRTSTTNWSDRFTDADQFPQILAAENRDQYIWPKVPELNANQLRLVGWDEQDIAS